MANQHIIPNNWNEQVEQLIGNMKAANTAALKHSPESVEHKKLWEVYEGACQDFLQHLEENFGGVQGFSNFLKYDLRQKMRGAGLSTDLVDKDQSWEIADHENSVTEAEQASSQYRIKYGDMIEGLAFNKAFLHNDQPKLNF